MNKQLIVSSAVMLAALLCRQTNASPSGLNNTPTADTPGDQVVVLQAYDTFGKEREHDFSAGMKFGLRPWNEKQWAPRLEGGLDSHLLPNEGGPVVFQAKLAIQPLVKGPTMAVGSANLAVREHDRERVGQAFNYFVLSQGLKYFRLHGGHGWQKDNNAWFAGIDTTLPVLKQPLTLRADAVQIQDRDQWLVGLGLMYQLNRNLVIEGWSSLPTERGLPSFTLKLNWIFDFGPKH